MERSSLSRSWRGLCANSSLLVGDEVQNLCVAFEYWGALSMFSGASSLQSS